MFAQERLMFFIWSITLAICSPFSAGFAQRHSAGQTYDHPRLSVELLEQPDSTLKIAAELIARGIVNPSEVVLHVFQSDLDSFHVDFDMKDAPMEWKGFKLERWCKADRAGRDFDVKAVYAKPAHHTNSAKDAPPIFYYSIKAFRPFYQTLYLSGGSFQIATNEGQELSRSTVKIDSLCIGIHEVSNEQFRQFLSVRATSKEEAKKWLNLQSRFSRIEMQKNKWIVRDSIKYANHPVVEVTWEGAKAFCKWLSDTEGFEGQSYRLPTEAEWEFAARSGKSEPMDYPNGKSMMGDNEGNFDGTFADDTTTVPVDFLLDKNAVGLFHFAGNVREWCESMYDSTDNKLDKVRVVRGGSWVLSSKYARLGFRDGMHQDSSAFDIGFRVVIDHGKPNH